MTLPNLKTLYYITTVSKTMLLTEGQTHGLTEHRNRPIQIIQTEFLSKIQKQFNGEKITFSSNGVGTLDICWLKKTKQNLTQSNYQYYTKANFCKN